MCERKETDMSNLDSMAPGVERSEHTGQEENVWQEIARRQKTVGTSPDAPTRYMAAVRSVYKMGPDGPGPFCEETSRPRGVAQMIQRG